MDVDLELDTEPREITVPRELRDALDDDAEAGRAFDARPTARSSATSSAVEGAKTAETRQRRIAKAVDELRASPR